MPVNYNYKFDCKKCKLNINTKPTENLINNLELASLSVITHHTYT